MRSSRHPAIRLAICVACLCVALSVPADEGDDLDLTDLSLEQLLEVSVISEKREYPLQESTVAITVLSSEQIEQNNYDNLVDLAKMVPSTHAGSIFSDINFSIRGIGNTDFKAVDDGVVRLVVDGVSLTGALYPWMNLYDIEQVEFARGPQGTIHGRNAMAGVISVTTRRPTDQYEVSSQLTFGNSDRRKIEAMANGPLSESFFARISVLYNENDPFIGDDIDFVNNRVTDVEDSAVRLQARWLPSDASELLVKLEYETKEGYERPFALVDITGVDLSTVPTDFANLRDHTIRGLTAQYKRMFPRFSLTYIGDVHESEEDQLQEYSPQAPSAVRQTVRATADQTSHELRLASTESEKWEWIAGINYFDSSESRISDIFVYVPGVSITLLRPQQDTESLSLFGQLTIRRGEFAYSLGLRYSDDSAKLRGSTITDTSAIGGGVTVEPSRGDTDWQNTVGKLGVSWAYEENAHLFASVSTGYKIGGFNVGLPPNEIGEESVVAWEIGHKAEWLDNKLRLNVAAFYNQYDDLQVGQNVGTGANIQSIVQNVGDATTYGLEAEWNWLFAPQWQLAGYVSLLHSEYGDVSLPDPNPFNPPSQIDISGNQLIKAPGSQANVRLGRRWSTSGGGALDFSWLTYYQGKIFFSAFNQPLVSEGSFVKSDVSLSWTDRRNRWNIAFYVNNLTDKSVFGEMSSNGVATLGVLEPGREIGLRLGLRSSRK